ncbi:hypothetical protein Hte_006373 [Hypoxylon texense]
MSKSDEKWTNDTPTRNYNVPRDNSIRENASQDYKSPREAKQPEVVEQSENTSLTFNDPSAAIIGVLQAYDQSSLAQLPFQITLNSYLAFLTTLAKAALMPPVAEALSQIKWNWFHVDRPLEDIQVFDAASRGTFGSLFMLMKMNCGVTTRLGALAMALGLFTSPITQQLIDYPSRLVPSPHGQATIPVIQQVQIADDVFTLPYAALELAITTGLGSTKSIEPIPPDCPTSNCTFPQFDSLGFCVRTADITDFLSIDRVEDASPVSPMYNLTLTEDCYLTTQEPFSFTTCVEGSSRSIAFRDKPELRPGSLFSVFYIFQAPNNISKNAIQWGVPVHHSAVEILVSLCVQTFEVSVSKGITETKLLSTVSEEAPRPHRHAHPGDIHCPKDRVLGAYCEWPNDGMENGGMENLEDIFFLRNPRKPGSDLDQDLYGTTYGFLLNLHVDMLATTPDRFSWLPSNGVADMGNLLHINPIEALFLEYGIMDANILFSTVESVYHNVSTALTNQLRMLQPYNGSQNSFLINGTAWEPETYVSIRWGWITLLAAQVAFGTACCGFAIWQSHQLRIPILKSSALAMIFALGDEFKAPHGIESIETVRERTSKIHVRLQDGELVRTDPPAD